MSTLTVGRFSVDATDKADLSGDGGNLLAISGEIIGSTLAEAKAKRQQCLGLANNRDELFVPFTYSEDSSLDGFYRVKSVKVSTIPLSLVVFTFRFEIQLERVSNWTQPVVELFSAGASRTNIPMGVTASYWSAVPSDAQAYDRAGASLAAKTRTGPGGSVKWYGASAYSNAYAKLLLAPSDWYDMAATIEVGGYPVVGDQIPGEGNETNWKIGNGLVELRGVGVSGGSGGSYLADLVFPNTAGTGWGTGYGLQFGWYDGAAFQNLKPAKSLYVVRNSPEECVLGLRLFTQTSTDDSQAVDLCFRLRRGSFIIEASFAASIDQKYGVKTNSTVACTAFNTLNYRADADDADTNRLVVVTTTANTQDGNGRIYATSNSTKVVYGLCCERAGGSSVAPNVYTDLRDQFMAAMSETVSLGTGQTTL